VAIYPRNGTEKIGGTMSEEETTGTKEVVQLEKPTEKPVEEVAELKPAVLAENKTEDVKKVEEVTPAPKYTEEDFQKALKGVKEKESGRYSNLDKKLTETINTYTEKVADLERQIAERTYDNFIKTVEGNGGDVDTAKLLMQKQREISEMAGKQAKERVELERDRGVLREAGRNKAALDLVKENGLDESDIDELLTCETKDAMENKALKLRLTKKESELIPAKKIEDTKVKGTQIAIGNLKPTLALGTLMGSKDD